MATAPAISSEIPRNEKENLFRMQLLLMCAADVLRDVLRTRLQAAHPGLFDPNKSDKLFDILDNQQVKHSLLKLKKKNVVNSSQMDLLYPSGSPSTTLTTQDLDITLAGVLLRNITNLNPRAKWENPPASDTSIEANIGRVKIHRNKISHVSSGISDSTFQTEFQELKHVLLLLSSKYSSDDYDNLLIVPLDAKVAPCTLLSVQLPSKLAGLKGREDLVQQIQQHIAGETRLVLLTGMGGIGKTSVAIEVGLREQNVLYIDMRQVTNLDSVKLSLVQHYHPTICLKDLYADYQNMFTQTLSSLTSDTVLIFDNNDELIKSNLQGFQTLIQDILNSTKRITLLCTSREAFSLLSQNVTVVEVPPLDKTPSINILWEGKNNSPTDSELILSCELAEKCGGNPLALKLLSVQINQKTARRVLNRMKKQNVIESFEVANLPVSQGMISCLDMSYEALNTKEQKLFRALHIFPVSFSVEEVWEMFEIDEDECESTLDSLRNKSLLSADLSFYDLHPLLKDYATLQARKDQSELSRIQDLYCRHYTKQTPPLLLNLENPPSKETQGEVQKLLPHLKVTASLLSDQLSNKKLNDKTNLFLIACVFHKVALYPDALTIYNTLEILGGKDVPFQQIGLIIYDKIGDVLYRMGKYREGLAYFERDLKVKKKVLGEKHPDTARTCHNIGCALYEMGMYAEAHTYFKKFLEVQREIHGENHRYIATAYHNIAFALGDVGKYTEELTNLEKSLAVNREVFGEKHPDTASAYLDVGIALSNMGKYAEALIHYKKSLEVKKAIIDGNQHDTARIYQNIGITLLIMVNYEEARSYFEKSLEVQKEILGEKHPDIAWTCDRIGCTLCKMGKYAEALAYHEKSLDIQKEIFCEEYPDIVPTYHNIGNALCGRGKYRESLSYFEKSLEIKKKAFGEKHPATAKEYLIVGNALSKMGKYAEALAYYENSLEAQKEKLGENHPDIVMIYDDIGYALFRTCKYKDALKYYEKSLEVYKNILGEKHPDSATTYFNIGCALHKMGRYGEARTSYEKSLKIQKEILGEKHIDTGDTCRCIGDALCDMGKHAEAIQYYENVLKIQKEILGEKHPDTGDTCRCIGDALCGMGKHAEAIQYYENFLKIQKEIPGETHPATASTYHEIGFALSTMGKYEEAFLYYEKSLEFQKEILGENHPDTARACHNIATTLLYMGEYAEALTCYEKSLEINKKALGEKHPDTAREYLNVGIASCLTGKYAEALTFLEKHREVFAEHYDPAHPGSSRLEFDTSVTIVQIKILEKVFINMSKYYASEFIVKGEFHEASRLLAFIGWDFKIYCKF